VNALNHVHFDAPFWNPITYTPTNHAGPTEVAVLRGDGQAKKWVQVSGFAGTF
jgi:hypothetical protein